MQALTTGALTAPWRTRGSGGRGRGVSYLITDVQREDNRENAGGWVPPVALQPAVEDVLDEGRVVNQDLRREGCGPG